MNSGENLMINDNVDDKDEVVVEQIINCVNPVASTSSKYLTYEVILLINLTILSCNFS